MTTAIDHSDTLADLRQQIDQLDHQLLRLLAQRQRLVRQVCQCKADPQAIPAYERLLPMLQVRAEQATALGLDADFIVRLFQQIAHRAMASQRTQLARQGQASTSVAELPLVYSCSGCSSAAQLANDLAVALDREQLAEMSCIAGVGGDVPALLKPALSGRPILAIDGCSRACAKRCLQRHRVEPTQHVVLTLWGVQKRLHQDYRATELLDAKQKLRECLDGITHSMTAIEPKPAS